MMTTLDAAKFLVGEWCEIETGLSVRLTPATWDLRVSIADDPDADPNTCNEAEEAALAAVGIVVRLTGAGEAGEYIETIGHDRWRATGALRDAILASDCAVVWDLQEGDHWYDHVLAASADDALAIAEANVDAANYPGVDGDGIAATEWIQVRVRCHVLDVKESATVQIDPEEPECERDAAGEYRSHDWSRARCRGEGAGVVVTEACDHCGIARTTRTLYQSPYTGEVLGDRVSYSREE